MCAEPAYPYDECPEPVVAPGGKARPLAVVVPVSSQPRPSSTLNGTAESIGAAVGKTVETIQHLPQRLQEMKQRLTVVRGRARHDMAAKAEDIKEEAVERVAQVRSRADSLAHRYPLQTIQLMAGIGVVLGIALRLWRDHAD